ncbi:MAG: Ig-like domain-containing protein [Chloroflexota bacterium]
MMILVSNQRLKRWSLLSMVLVASLSIWVGNQVLHARQVEATSDQPLEQRISMSYVSDSDLFEVSGWTLSELQQIEAYATTDLTWSDILAIHITLPERDIRDLPPVIGTYEISQDGSTLVFQPRFGWSAGQSYTAMLDLSVISEIVLFDMTSEENMLEWLFLVPALEVPSDLPTVTTIYPTANELPENLLRFYIEFSQPMQRGNVYDVVQLLDTNGNEVEFPFLRIGQEFWDRDMQVLTIILDPGRIKQGVAPNLQAGAPLINDGSYQLVISADLTDAYGRTLEQDIIKSFTVIAPDYQSPDPTLWTTDSPTLGTHDALTVELDGAIDTILAPRLIRVEDESGQSVPVNVSFGEHERLLYLTPVQAWSSGHYRLAVHPTLEDYAGNRVESLFDMSEGTVADLAATANKRQPVYIDFQVVTDR